MKYLLTILCFGILASSGFTQTLKSLMYNTTNGQVVYSGTNTLTFTNAVSFGSDYKIDGNGQMSYGGTPFFESETQTWFLPFNFEYTADAATTRANLGFSTNLNTLWSATNQIAVRQALGLQSYTNTLTNSVNNIEIGSTVSNITIGWTIAPTDATYAVRTLVGAGQTNSITNNSSTLAFSNLSLTSNTTWTLTVGDGAGATNTATTTLSFLNYMSWGRSTNTTLDNAAIQSLHTTGGGASRAFATSRNRSFTMDGGGQYIFIAYPAGFGAASFTVGGLPNTAFTLTTNTYTNVSGYVTNYLIYRTDTIQNGTGINFVVQ